MRRHFHRKRNSLNFQKLGKAHKSRTACISNRPFENTYLFARKLLHPHGRFRQPLLTQRNYLDFSMIAHSMTAAQKMKVQKANRQKRGRTLRGKRA
jgi:hypothetical protein